MNHLAHILLFTLPVVVITNTNHEAQYKATDVFVPKPLMTIEEKPDEFLPKSECNFANSSEIASKKVKYFAYDCLQPNNNWLLIHASEANYFDVLR